MYFGGTLAGTGTIVLQGIETPGAEPAFISPYLDSESNAPTTIGPGITIRGGTAKIDGVEPIPDFPNRKLINFGTIISDSPSQSIQITNMENRGGIVAAPGTVKLDNVTLAEGSSLTAAIGGSVAGVSYGVFDWTGSQTPPRLGGTFNAVLLDVESPVTTGTYTVARFASKTGAFSETNLTAGATTRFALASNATNLQLTASPHTTADASVRADGASLNGTDGDDVIDCVRSGGVAKITRNAESLVVYAPDEFAMTGYGSDGDDLITVSGVRSVSFGGGDGNDTITGSGGNDNLQGGPGNDVLYGTAGADTLNGDAGDDSIYAGPGADNVSGGTGNDLLQGGSGYDSMLGDDGFDTLLGGNGNDTLQGGLNADLLYGGLDEAGYASGNDSLVGGRGPDSLFGGDGDDTLAGGQGPDLLAGGSGQNQFITADGYADTLSGTAGATLLERDQALDVVLA